MLLGCIGARGLVFFSVFGASAEREDDGKIGKAAKNLGQTVKPWEKVQVLSDLDRILDDTLEF